MRKKILIIVIILISIQPEVLIAGTSFEDIYKQSSSFNIWTSAAIGIVFALAAGAAIFFTGGTVSPAVATIGTWFGTMMGLSGAAATNAGLALIGGGSLAAGGFGKVGGAVIITAALTFNNEIAFEYAYSKVSDTYSYSKFQKESYNLINFPLPLNKDGSELYTSIINDLEKNHEENNKIDYNKPAFKYSIERLEVKRKNIGIDSKESSLLALLYFIKNDYIKAFDITQESIENKEIEDSEVTLIINSIAGIYKEGIDLKKSINKFNQAVKKLDEKYKPLVYSIFLDRLFYRVISEDIPYEELIEIFNPTYEYETNKIKSMVTDALIKRSIIYIKLQQQKILSIYKEKNLAVWGNSSLPEFLSESLDQYLIAAKFISEYSSLLKEEINDSIQEKIIIKTPSKWEEEWINLVDENIKISEEYIKGYNPLRLNIYEIYQYQEDTKKKDKGFFESFFSI